MATGSRTAFTAALLLDRRQAASSAAITAVAVDQQGLRLYLGLEDGVLEEHAVVHGILGIRASLAARKHTAKKAILAIHLLPAQGLVVLLSEDGVAQVLDGDTLEGRLLPLRHAVAVCVAMPQGRPPLLALATKPSRKSIRFVVYELMQPTAGSAHPLPQHLPNPQLLAQVEVPDSSSAVHGMGWVGGQLAVCVGMRYLLVSLFGPAGSGGSHWRELLAVPEELAYSPAMLAAVPDLGRAVLVVGPAGIVVDAAGNPVGSTLRLEGLGATPRALAASGAFLLVVSEAGIHVFDRDSGTEVQRLGFGPGLRPAPGQILHAAAADPISALEGSNTSGEPGGGCVAVAGRRLVWLCLPVSPVDQARELLGQGEYEAALELVEQGLHRGAGWAQVAAAQAALLLLHECRFEEAARCLDRCAPPTFQPFQLFPLFPTYTAAWAQQVTAHQQYWGLHAPLPSLETLISRCIRPRQQQQQCSNGSSGPQSPSGASGSGLKPGGSSRSSRLLAMESISGSAGSPATSPLPTSAASRAEWVGRYRDQQVIAAAAAAELEGRWVPQNGGVQPPAEGDEQQGHARRELQRQAWESLAQYLFRVRMLEGVACLEGVDTLLLMLLADLGAARQVAAFAAVPNQVAVPAVEPRLQAEQWHHAVATLHAARGDTDVALRIWRQVVDGQLASPAGPEVQAAERQEALESAAALLRDPAACPETALVGYIPWLLAVSQAAALGVLTTRSLTPAAMLPLLPPESDVRWQYLAHLVAAEEGAGPAADPALHTELAIQLVAAILRADPLLRAAAPQRSTPRHRVTGTGSSGGDRPLSRLGSFGGGSATTPVASRRSSRSTAALVSGGGLQPSPGAPAVDAMRLRLRAHLEAPRAYDAEVVLRSLQGTGLHEELVVLHAQVGDHMSALRVLALTLHDVAAAEAYARALLAPGDYRALLHLVLEPGPGLEPHWEDACYLITALGDHLDPQEVLCALPAGMPLPAAVAVVAPMLRDRLHRRRMAALTKSLHRARLAAAAGVRCDAELQYVTVDEERACPHCHLRLGGKVFVVVQPGMLPGSGPVGADPAAAASAVAGSRLAPATTAAAAAAAGPSLQPQLQQQQSFEEPESLRPPGNGGLAAATRHLQQQLTAKQAPQVLCYACYRRLGGESPLPSMAPP